MANIKIIFFDVGNVLIERVQHPVDFIAQQLDLNNSVAHKAFKSLDDEKEIRNLWMGMRDIDSQKIYAKKAAELAVQKLNIKNTPETRELIVNAWMNQLYELKSDALEAIKTLHKYYRLGIISNAMPSRRINELRYLKLIEYFDPIILSREFGLEKPHKKIFEHALKKADAMAHEAAFVDDKLFNLKGAQEIGFAKLFHLVEAECSKPTHHDIADINSLLDIASQVMPLK